MWFYFKGYLQGAQKKNPVDFVLDSSCIVQLPSASGDVVLVKLAVLVTSYVRKYKKSVYIFFLAQQPNSGLSRLIF